MSIFCPAMLQKYKQQEIVPWLPDGRISPRTQLIIGWQQRVCAWHQAFIVKNVQSATSDLYLTLEEVIVAR